MYSRIEIIKRIDSLKGDMGQKEFGEIIGCKQGKVSGLLNLKGTKNFSVEELEKIADYFNVSVDYILGRNTPEVEITPRKFCRVLAEVLESSFPWSLVFIEQDEFCHQDGKIETKTYPALYFSENNEFNWKIVEEDNGELPFTMNDYRNQVARQINEYLQHVARLKHVEEKQAIEHTDFKELVEIKLSKVVDSIK